MRLLKLLVPFLLIFSIGCVSQGNIHLSGPEIAKVANNSTVALITQSDQRVFCTGVWVSTNIILSANHCVEGYAKMLYKHAILDALKKDGCNDFLLGVIAEMDFDDLATTSDDAAIQHILDIIHSIPKVNPMGLEIPYTVQSKVVNNGVPPTAFYHGKSFALSQKEDLALIKVYQNEGLEEHSVAVLADKTPEVGETVYSMGHGSGSYYSFKDGVVSAYKDDMSHDGMSTISGPYMEVLVPIWFGDSGGAMLNSDGKLVGINSFIETDSRLSFCVHLETIRGFLQGQKIVPVHLDLLAPDPS